MRWISLAILFAIGTVFSQSANGEPIQPVSFVRKLCPETFARIIAQQKAFLESHALAGPKMPDGLSPRAQLQFAKRKLESNGIGFKTGQVAKDKKYLEIHPDPESKNRFIQIVNDVTEMGGKVRVAQPGSTLFGPTQWAKAFVLKEANGGETLYLPFHMLETLEKPETLRLLYHEAQHVRESAMGTDAVKMSLQVIMNQSKDHAVYGLISGLRLDEPFAHYQGDALEAMLSQSLRPDSSGPQLSSRIEELLNTIRPENFDAETMTFENWVGVTKKIFNYDKATGKAVILITTPREPPSLQFPGGGRIGRYALRIDLEKDLSTEDAKQKSAAMLERYLRRLRRTIDANSRFAIPGQPAQQ